jgi:hypothetical protein
MAKRNLFSIFILIWIALASLATFFGAAPAFAQNSAADYTFLVASGFLCDPGDSSTCPAVVKSENGDRYEISGAGTLNALSKSVTAAGTYSHKTSDGISLETGVWIASELVSFDSYGSAPGELLSRAQAFEPPQLGARRTPRTAALMPTGGRAVFRIRLLPMWGMTKIATLQVNCAIGKVPPEHPVEGMRLAVEDGGPAFDLEVSGRSLFVLAKPAETAASKAPAAAGDANRAPDVPEH